MQNAIESDPRSYEATKKHLQKKLRKREWERERERGGGGGGGLWFMVYFKMAKTIGLSNFLI